MISRAGAGFAGGRRTRRRRPCGLSGVTHPEGPSARSAAFCEAALREAAYWRPTTSNATSLGGTFE
jgi:hypothetical protein